MNHFDKFVLDPHFVSLLDSLLDSLEEDKREEAVERKESKKKEPERAKVSQVIDSHLLHNYAEIAYQILLAIGIDISTATQLHARILNTNREVLSTKMWNQTMAYLDSREQEVKKPTPQNRNKPDEPDITTLQDYIHSLCM